MRKLLVLAAMVLVVGMLTAGCAGFRLDFPDPHYHHHGMVYMPPPPCDPGDYICKKAYEAEKRRLERQEEMRKERASRERGKRAARGDFSWEHDD